MEYSNKTGLPSVSDIMNPYEDTRWFKEWHSTRGNITHGWICADLMDLFTPDIPPAYEGYINSYMEFKPYIKRVIAIEKRFTSERGFCGQVDLAAIVDTSFLKKPIGDVVAICDWKTSKAAYISWQARIGGYSILAKENGIPCEGGMTIRLREEPIKKGFFPLVDFYNSAEMRENEIDFLCALRTYSNILKDGQIYTNYEPYMEE